MKTNGILEIDALFATAAKAKKDEKMNPKTTNTHKLSLASSSNPFSLSSLSSSKQNPVKINCQYNRSDAFSLQKSQWASDGLGGVFNSNGFTGRRESDSGYKIYKAHLFNKKEFG